MIVEFLQGNKVLQGYVLEVQNGQLRLYTIGKREVKLPASRVLPWVGPAYSAAVSATPRQDMLNRMEEHRVRREEAAAAFNLEELWELAQGEVRKAPLSFFASLFLSDPTIDQLAALGQSLLADKTRFKFSPPEFEVYSAAEVETRLKKREEEDRLERAVTAGAGLFRALWEISAERRGPLAPAEEPEPGLAELFKKMLLTRLADPDATENDALWKMLVKGLPDDPHLPLLLAVAWGLKPRHYNFWLDRAGYSADEDWAAPLADYIGHLTDEVTAASRRAGTSTPDAPPAGVIGFADGFISIDPETTLDHDDSFKLESRPGGGCTLTLALACPGLFWPFGTDLDRAVAARSSSIYLPEGTLHMLPRDLTIRLFSLMTPEKSATVGGLNPKPALLAELELDADGALLATRPRLAWVRMAANLTHAESESAMREGEGAGETLPRALPYAPMLRDAARLAALLQAERIRHGAVITERPEIQITLTEEAGEVSGGLRVDLTQESPYPRTHNVVGEFMILCNRALTAFCAEKKLPLFYRTQDVALPKEFAGVWTHPAEVHKVIKALPPANLELVGRPHAGLGAALYATFSSPMRRYSDLVNEAQLAHYLLHGAPRLEREEMEEILAPLAVRQGLAAQVQRYRPRYWKLLYFLQQNQLKREGGRPWWEAVVVEENDNFVVVSLEAAQISLRVPRSRLGDKVHAGDRVLARLGKISPLHNEIQVMEAMEY